MMRYKFDVSIHRNKIDDPIAERYPPTTFSPRYFINVLADNLATISPALKNTITSPPKNKGANKSFVSHREDQSIMIPIVAKLNINKIPKIKTRFFGNSNLEIASLVSSFSRESKKINKYNGKQN